VSGTKKEKEIGWFEMIGNDEKNMVITKDVEVEMMSIHGREDQV